MTDKDFWKIIDSIKEVPIDGYCDALRTHLDRLTPAEIVSFRSIFDRIVEAAATHDLWGAALLINGASDADSDPFDDRFYYFRDWLVTRGQKVYEAALVNPDSLASIIDPDEGELELESSGETVDVWCQKTGQTDDAFYDALDRLEELNPPRATDSGLLGEPWDYDDDEEIVTRFPKLAELFLEDGGEGEEY